jgi:crotonobetainyl-CoA:carnitine CoA-transferase CaiB-like acyl-CoA transferase
MIPINDLKNTTLSGVRVLCIEDLIALPWGTMYLADLGADVIRAESHTRLRARAWGPFPNGVADPDKWWNQGGSHGLYYRNKKSLTLDLTKPEGIELLKELVKVTDIVAENSRPGVMDRLGIGYDTLKQIKPDLIMIGSSGFGQTGDWKSYGAVARIIDGICGMSYTTGYKDDDPVRANPSYMDISTGWNMVLCSLLALHHRRKTGEGQYVDLSMYETGTTCIGPALLDEQVNRRDVRRIGNGHSRMAPHGCYPCIGKDRWVVIAIETDIQWNRFKKAIGSPHWVDNHQFDDVNSRIKHSDKLDALISNWTKHQSDKELMELLQSESIPCSSVYDARDLLTDDHLKSRKFFEPLERIQESAVSVKPYVGRPFKMSKTPAKKQSVATLGEHNKEILGNLLGIADQKIDLLHDNGVIDWKPSGPEAVTPGGISRVMVGNDAVSDPDFERVNELHADS